MSLQVVNRTEFDLPTVKLVRSVLYAECSLPCSATLRTPLQVIFQRISFQNLQTGSTLGNLHFYRMLHPEKNI